MPKPSTNTLQVPRLNLVSIQSTAPDLSVQFYSLLGLSFVKHRHGEGPEHYSSENNSYVLEIYPSNSPNRPSPPLRIGFATNAFDSLIKTLIDNKTKFLVEPKMSPWGKRMVLLDPDQNRVEVVESNS